MIMFDAVFSHFKLSSMVIKELDYLSTLPKVPKGDILCPKKWISLYLKVILCVMLLISMQVGTSRIESKSWASSEKF